MATCRSPGATRTVLLYGHYDGQPVDAARWKQRSPFVPILRDGRLEDGGRDIPKFGSLTRFEPQWRLYARSAADDKAPLVALCAALDALKASGIAPTANVRVLIDGELESGSPSLDEVVAAHRAKLDADLLVLLDDPVHPRGGPTVVFGARGALGLELTTYGPKFGVHSGHYGNWVPNPGIRLARLLASMKDDDGQVLVKGFYDGIEPLHADEEALLRSVPDDAPSLMALFGIAAPERKGLSLQQALQLPSLNIRGLSSAYTGPDARTIIPDTATAALDIRLVKETPAREMVEKIAAHIRAQGYFITQSDPDDADQGPAPADRQDGDSRRHQRVPHVAAAARIAQRRGGARADVRRAPDPDSHQWGDRPGGGGPHRVAGGAGDLVADRELRQQPAWREREPAPRPPVHRHRLDRRRAHNVGRLFRAASWRS